MAAVELRRGKVEQAVIVLIDQTSAFLGRRPILAGDLDRRLDARGLALDRRQCFARLRRHDRRHPRLENAGLLPRDLAYGIAEVLGVVERDRRDHAGQRVLDHIGRVQPSAQPDLEQEHIRRVARKKHEPGGGRDLEHGDGRAGIGALAFGQRFAELLVRGEASFMPGFAEAKALVEAHEMRRGVDVHGEPRRLQDRAHEGDGGALAVGAGDMDHRRQLALGMTERIENAPHPIERKIDQLGMQGREPRDDGIDGGHGPRPRITVVSKA